MVPPQSLVATYMHTVVSLLLPSLQTMSTVILLALVLSYACIESADGIMPSLDTARPLVRFSPTRGTADPLYANDGFGYSAAIHHTVADLNSLTLEEVLEQVR